MQNVTPYNLALALRQSGRSAASIASELSLHRATVHRWLRGIRYRGLRQFERDMATAKQGRRRRRIDAVTVKLICRIRRQYGWCGQKIRFWLAHTYGRSVSLASVYRVLDRHFVLRSKWKPPRVMGPVPRASRPREVLQSDTVDLGGTFFAYTTVDIFTREADVRLGTSLEAVEGARCLAATATVFGPVLLWQADGGSEFKAEADAEMRRHALTHRTARAYKKNEQAFIESFNRTLRKQCVGHHRWTLRERPILEAKIQAFLQLYNHLQPHMSLNYQTPAAVARVSHLT